MTFKKLILAATVAAAAFIVGPSLEGSGPAFAACDPGEKLDGSTADMAKRKIEAAGFRQVKNLRKGCDSFWHATAAKDGVAGRVVLSPAGEVRAEND